MGLQETKIESLPFVTAELNYLAPTEGKPRTYAYDPPPGEPKSTNLPEPHDVPIFDGRPIANSFSLDREGFALVKHPTIVRNFYDESEIRRVYYPAAEAFLRATLGAESDPGTQRDRAHSKVSCAKRFAFPSDADSR